MVQNGDDVTVYTTNLNGEGGCLNVALNEEITLGGVKVWYFRSEFGKVGFYSGGLYRALKNTIDTFDIVHMSATWQWIGIQVSTICRRYGKPYVISPHSSYSPWAWSHKRLKKLLFWYLFSRKAAQYASAIHFTAEGERKKALGMIPLLRRIPSFVVPNGIDLARIRKRGMDWRKELHIGENDFVVLFIGRIHRKKGIHLIFEALRILQDGNFVFLIVGNKEDESYVRVLESQSVSLPNRVVWKECVPRDEIWDFYACADLFVLPSFDENFGMAVVESLASGLPVMISRNVDIHGEIEKDRAGFIVDMDGQEIADLLRALITERETVRQAGRNAMESANKRFSIDTVTGSMRTAYYDIVNGTSSAECRWTNHG